MLFVEDLIEAMLLARRNIGKLSGRAFNIGGGPGNTVSLLELIKRLEELLERSVQLSFDAWRVGDQRYYVSDTSRLGAATGWHARTEVERGLLALCEWFRTSAEGQSAERADAAGIGFGHRSGSAARRTKVDAGMSAMAMQRAAILVRPMTTQVREVEIPEPAGSQVRVRLQGSGICASNLPVWEGRPWFNYPLDAGSPGHEGWGFVDALGTEVRDLEIGQRIALMSGHAYAEYDVAARECVVPLVEDEPFPGEPLACAMNIFERSDIRGGHTVAIVGAGFLGLLLTQLAADAGAHVVTLSHRASALQLAMTMDAEETVQTRDDGKDAHSCVLSWWQAVHGAPAPAEWGIYRHNVSRGLNNADRVIAPTHAFLRQLQSCYGMSRPAEVIRNGRPTTQAAARSSAVRSKREPLILACGRLWDAAKNLRLLDAAAAGLPWHTYVVGDTSGPDGQTFIPATLRPLGALAHDDVERWLQRTSIFAHPALYEPFGLAVLEAAAAGCALVLSDISTLRESWDGVPEFHNPCDSAQLRAALDSLVTDPAKRSQLGAAAQRRAAEFGVEATAAAYAEVYRSLLAGGTRAVA